MGIWRDLYANKYGTYMGCGGNVDYGDPKKITSFGYQYEYSNGNISKYTYCSSTTKYTAYSYVYDSEGNHVYSYYTIGGRLYSTKSYVSCGTYTVDNNINIGGIGTSEVYAYDGCWNYWGNDVAYADEYRQNMTQMYNDRVGTMSAHNGNYWSGGYYRSRYRTYTQADADSDIAAMNKNVDNEINRFKNSGLYKGGFLKKWPECTAAQTSTLTDGGYSVYPDGTSEGTSQITRGAKYRQRLPLLCLDVSTFSSSNGGAPRENTMTSTVSLTSGSWGDMSISYATAGGSDYSQSNSLKGTDAQNAGNSFTVTSSSINQQTEQDLVCIYHDVDWNRYPLWSHPMNIFIGDEITDDVIYFMDFWSGKDQGGAGGGYMMPIGVTGTEGISYHERKQSISGGSYSSESSYQGTPTGTYWGAKDLVVGQVIIYDIGYFETKNEGVWSGDYVFTTALEKPAARK